MSKQVQVKKNEIPEGWSTDSADFVNRVLFQKLLIYYMFQLLQRKPSNRLGLRGAAEVKDHPWIKYFDWNNLYEKKIEAPFIPKVFNMFK